MFVNRQYLCRSVAIYGPGREPPASQAPTLAVSARASTQFIKVGAAEIEAKQCLYTFTAYPLNTGRLTRLCIPGQNQGWNADPNDFTTGIQKPAKGSTIGRVAHDLLRQIIDRKSNDGTACRSVSNRSIEKRRK